MCFLDPLFSLTLEILVLTEIGMPVVDVVVGSMIVELNLIVYDAIVSGFVVKMVVKMVFQVVVFVVSAISSITGVSSHRSNDSTLSNQSTLLVR